MSWKHDERYQAERRRAGRMSDRELGERLDEVSVIDDEGFAQSAVEDEILEREFARRWKRDGLMG